MTTFTEFVQNKALSDRLPFAVDFDMGIIESDKTETIGRYEIRLQDDLTVGESWFFGLIQDFQNSNTTEFQLLIKVLADKLKKAMKLDSVAEAGKYILTPKPEWSDSDDYLKFNISNKSDLDRVMSLYRLLNNDLATDMLLITFFMKSRYNTEWTTGNTASMGVNQLRKVKDLIKLEANGGIDPDEVIETEDDSESEEKAGK